MIFTREIVRLHGYQIQLSQIRIKFFSVSLGVNCLNYKVPNYASVLLTILKAMGKRRLWTDVWRLTWDLWLSINQKNWLIGCIRRSIVTILSIIWLWNLCLCKWFMVVIHHISFIMALVKQGWIQLTKFWWIEILGCPNYNNTCILYNCIWNNKRINIRGMWSFNWGIWFFKS